MAGRHIKDLLAAYRDRDDLLFRRAAQAIIEEEEAKRHTALAGDLRRLLASGGSLEMSPFEAPLPEAPKDRDTAMPLVDMATPDRGLSDLILADQVATRLREVVDEVPRWPVLDAMAVPRRNRLLLYGPPGCGKTSIAEAVAGELGRILVTVRVESVISSYLGETASNLRRVLDFASGGAYVVLFDEFDSLAKDRDDPADHGELRRVVNAVLQLIDRYKGPSILIAATNHSQVLDNAMWRRFDEVLEVPLPTRDQLLTLLQRTVVGPTKTLGLERVADQLGGYPHAAAKAVVYGALRTAIARGRKQLNDEDFESGLVAVTSRRWQ